MNNKLLKGDMHKSKYFFSHFKLWVGVAIDNFKWAKIIIL